MILIKKLFPCCINTTNDIEKELNLLQPLNDINYISIPDNELIPKYINYEYTFNITENKFICSSLNVILESIINKNIQLTFISRTYSEKNFFILHGNKNYKIFEILCIYGDIINLNFKLDYGIIIFLSYINSKNEKHIESFEIMNKNIKVKVTDEFKLIKIYIKYGSLNFYQDILSICSIWFQNFDVHHTVDYNPDILIDTELNAILIGFIKPMSNILTYNY